MSSWSTPSPDTPTAPTSCEPRKIGTLPAKICKPLATSGGAVLGDRFTVLETGGADRATPAQLGPTSVTGAPAAYKTCCRMALIARSSCRPVENTLHCPLGLLKGPN